MKFHLVVLRPFDGYKRGELITDAAVVQKIIAGPNANAVVRVTVKEA